MMFDLWSVYSGERFRASGPSCLYFFYLCIFFDLQLLISNITLVKMHLRGFCLILKEADTYKDI